MPVSPATILAALVVDLNSSRTVHGFQPGVASNGERPDPASEYALYLHRQCCNFM